jgi:hypothetical protein
MTTLDLAERARALEDLFFQPLSDEARARLRAELRAPDPADALRAASGIADPELLTRLDEIGVAPATLLAVTLVPLIEVAWADGRIQQGERDAILRGADESGVTTGAAHALLDRWLEARPPETLGEAWSRVVHALDERLLASERKQLMAEVASRARAIAEAAGGFLGIGAVSNEEHEVIDRLEAAFKFPEQFRDVFRRRR